MGFLVRSGEGELHVWTREELVRAVQVGLIAGTDEVRTEGDSAWQRISDVLPAGTRLLPDHAHWYVLAAVLAVEGYLWYLFFSYWTGTLMGYLVCCVMVRCTFVLHQIWCRNVRSSVRVRRPPGRPRRGERE